MPITTNDVDMPKWGWVKELMYESIICNENTRGMPICVELDYYANALRCGKCKSNQFVWIMVPQYDYMGGVFAACSRCGLTWGPLGEGDAPLRNPRDVSMDEAIKICLTNGIPVPEMLKQRLRASQAEQSRAAKGLARRPKRMSEIKRD